MATAKQTVLTEEGLKKLEDELETLKSIKRKEISEKIKVALSFGDLSENSEYDEAKNEQAITEARILEIETMLKNVQIIDEQEIDTKRVSIGSKVTIKNLKTEATFDYQIVGSSEANPIEGKISDESPVGSAVLGCKKGEKVSVKTPGGIVKYQVLDIYK